MAWNPEDLHHDVMGRALRGFNKGGLVSSADYVPTQLDTGQVYVTGKPILNWNESTDKDSSYQEEIEFLKKPGVKKGLDDIAKNHNITVNDLLNTIYVETNFSYEKDKINPVSNATGLIQFHNDKGKKYKTIAGQQYTTEQIAAMTHTEQLGLVNTYFNEMHPIKNNQGEWVSKSGKKVLGGYAHPSLTVAFPSAHYKEMDTILVKKNSAVWNQNPKWRDKNGNITKRSILKHYDGLKKYDTNVIANNSNTGNPIEGK